MPYRNQLAVIYIILQGGASLNGVVQFFTRQYTQSTIFLLQGVFDTLICSKMQTKPALHIQKSFLTGIIAMIRFDNPSLESIIKIKQSTIFHFLDCIAGYYMNGTTCTQCAINTYNANEDTSTSCLSCPLGQITGGLTGQSSCIGNQETTLTFLYLHFTD